MAYRRPPRASAPSSLPASGGAPEAERRASKNEKGSIQMSRFSRIFDVFSRRAESPSGSRHDISETFRNRTLLWCSEVFSNSRSAYGKNNYSSDFWEEIHRFLQYRLGRIQLSNSHHPPTSPVKEAITYLAGCPGETFLDFLEYVFRVDCLCHIGLPEAQLVEELNSLLRTDNLPYHMTDFVKETVREVVNEHPFAGQEMTVIKTVAYPKVIMKDSEVMHVQAIDPALQLLQRPEFRSANLEFLEALEDYRKDDFGDCLTKCGSAFESVMKILCDRKSWRYSQTDTASTLVKTVLSNTSLGSYFEPTLMIIVTLRNRLSKSHGAGTGSRNIPRHLASYALNATASAILLLMEEAGVV